MRFLPRPETDWAPGGEVSPRKGSPVRSLFLPGTYRSLMRRIYCGKGGPLGASMVVDTMGHLGTVQETAKRELNNKWTVQYVLSWEGAQGNRLPVSCRI